MRKCLCRRLPGDHARALEHALCWRAKQLDIQAMRWRSASLSRQGRLWLRTATSTGRLSTRMPAAGDKIIGRLVEACLTGERCLQARGVPTISWKGLHLLTERKLWHPSAANRRGQGLPESRAFPEDPGIGPVALALLGTLGLERQTKPQCHALDRVRRPAELFRYLFQ
jgi:hypothetical protein